MARAATLLAATSLLVGSAHGAIQIILNVPPVGSIEPITGVVTGTDALKYSDFKVR